MVFGLEREASVDAVKISALSRIFRMTVRTVSSCNTILVFSEQMVACMTRTGVVCSVTTEERHNKY